MGLAAWFGGILPVALVGWRVSNALRLLFCLLATYQLITLIRDARSQLRELTSEPSEECVRTTYAVPRRFGLGTMMLVTFVFGLLFAAFKGLNTPPVVCILITSLLVFVGMLQMVFDKVPRTASAAAGAVSYPLTLFVALLIYKRTSILSLGFGSPVDVGYIVLSHVVIGEMLGYVAGVLVAGVFLVEERLVGYVFRSNRERHSRCEVASDVEGSTKQQIE